MMQEHELVFFLGVSIWSFRINLSTNRYQCLQMAKRDIRAGKKRLMKTVGKMSINVTTNARMSVVSSKTCKNQTSASTITQISIRHAVRRRFSRTVAHGSCNSEAGSSWYAKRNLNSLIIGQRTMGMVATALRKRKKWQNWPDTTYVISSHVSRSGMYAAIL